MNRIGKWILAVFLVLCVCIFAAAIGLYWKLFPIAEPVEVPKLETIQAITVGCNSIENSIAIPPQKWATLHQSVNAAKPTRMQLENDHPDTKPYYGITIETDSIQYRYFLYQNGETAYLEIPYYGIYKIEPELLSLLSQYFQEGISSQ